MLRRDGRLLPTRMSAGVVRPERSAPYLVVQITDLRDRIEAERAMAEALTAEAAAAAELRRIDAARKATAARLAHDLRSPLTVARAYQELVGTGAAGELNDDQAEMLEIALRNTDRVIDLVDDLVVDGVAAARPHRHLQPPGRKRAFGADVGAWTPSRR